MTASESERGIATRRVVRHNDRAPLFTLKCARCGHIFRADFEEKHCPACVAQVEMPRQPGRQL